MPAWPSHFSAPISSGPLAATGEVSVALALAVPLTYSWTVPAFASNTPVRNVQVPVWAAGPLEMAQSGGSFWSSFGRANPQFLVPPLIPR